eukprot:364185-Chlamydomonas_euryale.AAC.10
MLQVDGLESASEWRFVADVTTVSAMAWRDNRYTGMDTAQGTKACMSVGFERGIKTRGVKTALGSCRLTGRPSRRAARPHFPAPGPCRPAYPASRAARPSRLRAAWRRPSCAQLRAPVGAWVCGVEVWGRNAGVGVRRPRCARMLSFGVRGCGVRAQSRSWRDGVVAGVGEIVWWQELARSRGGRTWRDGVVAGLGEMVWWQELARWCGGRSWRDGVVAGVGEIAWWQDLARWCGGRTCRAPRG